MFVETHFTPFLCRFAEYATPFINPKFCLKSHTGVVLVFLIQNMFVKVYRYDIVETALGRLYEYKKIGVEKCIKIQYELQMLHT